MKKINKIVSTIEQYFIGILLLGVAFILFANVVMRVFGSSLIWAEELARFVIIWLTFVGSSVCVYKGAHIGVDAIMNILSERKQKILTIITTLISIVFAILFTYFSVIITKNILDTNQLSSTLGIPMAVVYAAMPVGGLLMAVRYIEQLVKNIKEMKN